MQNIVKHMVIRNWAKAKNNIGGRDKMRPAIKEKKM